MASTTTGNTLIPFYQGFLDDDFAKECQKLPDNQTFTFLHTGKRAQVGQRVETVVHFLDQHHQSVGCRLTGVVTAVGQLPTLEEWKNCQSFIRRLPTCHQCGLSPNHTPRVDVCPVRDCVTNRIGRNGTRPVTLESLMEACLDIHGTLQNQEIVTYQMLHPVDHEKMQGCDNSNLPLKQGRIYRIKFTANDTMACKWTVSSIEDVTDAKEPPADLPSIFLV